jgi:HEAT repeat protein
VADLARGLKLADPSERAAVVALNAGVNDGKVVKALAKYLKDKAREVRLATIEALGATRHAEALKELHRLCKAGGAEEDEGERVAVLKAIGRHGDKSSLAALGADAWEDHRVPVIRARVYAIAAVREDKSLALLMELLEKDPTVPWQPSPYTEHFRVALARLTGADRGSNRDGWRDWWREAKDKVKVSPDPPRAPAELQAAWDDFWKVTAAPAAPAAPPAKSG